MLVPGRALDILGVDEQLHLRSKLHIFEGDGIQRRFKILQRTWAASYARHDQDTHCSIHNKLVHRTSGIFLSTMLVHEPPLLQSPMY